MLVLMVHVWKVFMAVRQRLMAMPVHVFSHRVHTIGVHMLMVRIMFVFMAVLQNFVRMFMPVRLGQVQPDANSHEQAGYQQPQRGCLAQKKDGKQRTKKWGNREIGPRTCSAQVAQSDNEQHQAAAIA